MRILLAILGAISLLMIGVVQIGEQKICRGARFRCFFYDRQQGFGVEYEYPCGSAWSAKAFFLPFEDGGETQVWKCPGEGGGASLLPRTSPAGAPRSRAAVARRSKGMRILA